MKLIQIDNTLYIVEGENEYKVSEESVKELTTMAHDIWGDADLIYQHKFSYHLQQGINLGDIQHRIEIRNDNGNGCQYYEAFLLPEKEEKKISMTIHQHSGRVIINNVEYYSTEQIEKAIVFGIDIECGNIQRDYTMTAVQQFINNLTK